MSEAVVVELSLGTAHPGGWCTDCHNPALVTFDVLNISDLGVSKFGEVATCVDCGVCDED